MGCYIKRESARALLLPVPHLEALELPIGVERTTQKPHAEYVIIAAETRVPAATEYTYPTKASTAVSSLTPIEIFQIPKCQERASSKRFLICRKPTRLTLDRASA